MARGESAREIPADEAGYNTHAVERLTGVPATTFRAWERRYGVPSPRRLPGGQRVYSEEDVAQVRFLRDQTERGLTASRAVAQLRHGTATAARPAPDAKFEPARLAADLVRAAVAFDGGGVERTISQTLAAHPLDVALLEVVQPALVEIGERWHRGEITPAAEHFATGLVRRRLEQLASLLDAGPGRPLVVVGAAPGELHDVGALVFALLLRRRGIRVAYLGQSVPPDAVLDVARRMTPSLVCLSAATLETARGMDAISGALQALGAQAPRLLVGGRAFAQAPSLAERLGAIAPPADTRQAVDFVAQLLQ